MSIIKCFLIDDEPPAIELIENYINLVDHMTVVGSSHSAVKAFDQLKSLQIDLLFLDIQMPVLNGIQFLKTLQNPPAVIITTAYREYAIDGYDLDIIDYLLKPIAFDRFLKSVERYRSRDAPTPVIGHLTNQKIDHIYVNVNRTKHKILLNDINYIESMKDYVRIHTVHQKLMVKGNLGSFMKKVPSESIVRVHRSYSISIQKIQSYNQSEVVIDGTPIPVGHNYKNVIVSIIG